MYVLSRFRIWIFFTIRGIFSIIFSTFDFLSASTFICTYLCIYTYHLRLTYTYIFCIPTYIITISISISYPLAHPPNKYPNEFTQIKPLHHRPSPNSDPIGSDRVFHSAHFRFQIIISSTQR